MNARGILVGTKVELELFNSMDKKLGVTYSGEFMEIVSDMEVIIFSAEPEPVPPCFSKVWVRASFTHKIHGPLNFKGTLIRKEATKSGTKFHIKIDDEFQQIQKREYFRPDCFLKAEYRVLKKITDNEKSIEEIPYKRTETKNISFTGVCILMDENDNIAQNDLIDLVVWLKTNLSIKIQCKVVRIVVYEVRKGKKYKVGLSIESMNEDDSDLLTKFITRSIMNQSLYLGETPFNI